MICIALHFSKQVSAPHKLQRPVNSALSPKTHIGAAGSYEMADAAVRAVCPGRYSEQPRIQNKRHRGPRAPDQLYSTQIFPKTLSTYLYDPPRSSENAKISLLVVQALFPGISKCTRQSRRPRERARKNNKPRAAAREERGRASMQQQQQQRTEGRKKFVVQPGSRSLSLSRASRVSPSGSRNRERAVFLSL